MALGALQEEQLRIRHIQPAVSSLKAIDIPPPAVPAGLSPLSSIGEAGEVDQAPRLHFMLRLAGLQKEMEESYGASSKLFQQDIERNDQEIKELEAQAKAALKAEAEATKTRDTWGTLGLVAEYVGSAGIIAVGWSTGGVGGGLLVAAGVIGIGNRVIHDTNLLQPALTWLSKSEEKQQKIKANIEMGAFFLQLGFGLAGGVTVWRTAAQGATLASVLTRTQSTLLTASTIAGTSFKVGEAVYDRRVKYIQADQNEMKGAILIATERKGEEARQMGQMIEKSNDITKALQQAIADTQVEVG